MPRPTKSTSTERIVITGNPQMAQYLDDLVASGLLGASRAEVAKNLVGRGIEEQIGKGIIRVRV